MTTAEAVRRPRGAFVALTSRSYRIYIGGQSLANTGTWMQSVAQDWLVYDLTHSSTSVGVTMALQFLPILVLGLHTGGLADRLPKRRILLTTQTLNAAATTALAVITITGAVRPADVYAFALLSGLIFAFDAPARQAFVSEVVPPGQLRAAIALNAAVFQATRLIGPAIAAVLIANVGTGWVFALNAACYTGPAIGLLRLRPSDLTPAPVVRDEPGALRATVRYVARRPDILRTIFLVGMFGTFGLNFPIVLTAMAKSTFDGNASTYGLFNIVLAIGSVIGALFAGAAARPRPRAIAALAAAFGLLQTAAAIAPDLAVFLVLLAAMGLTNLAFQAMANASVQLAVDSRMRGRVMGLYMLAFIGGTPFGAPLIGVLTSHFGARVGMAVCGVIPVLAAAAVVVAARRQTDRADGRGPKALLSGGGLEFDHQLGGHPAAVFDLDALGFGPFADLGGVQRARWGSASGARTPSSTVGSAGSTHIACQSVAQLLGMTCVQVDLILGPVQPETDRSFGGAAVKVINEQGLDLLGHGRSIPLTDLWRSTVDNPTADHRTATLRHSTATSRRRCGHPVPHVLMLWW